MILALNTFVCIIISKSSSIVANENFITVKMEEEKAAPGVGTVQSLKIYDED